MKKKILIVNIFDSFAGSQRAIQTILRNDDASNKLVFYVLNIFGPGLISDASPQTRVFTLFKIESRRVRKIGFLLLFPFLFIIINFLQLFFARIIGNTIYCALLLLPTRKNYVLIHEVSRLPFILKKITEILDRYNCLVVSQTVNKKLGINGSVVYNPVDTRSKRENVANGTERLVYVGDYRNEKRFEYFIELTGNLRGIAGMKFDFVAYLPYQPTPSQSEYAMVEKANAAGIELNFAQFDPSFFFENSYAVIIPTDENKWVETFSYVACEALIFGVPIVATGISVLDELYEEAILVNKDLTPKQMSEAILAIDDVKYQKARFAAKDIAASYSFNNYLRKLSSSMKLDA
jgi:glycosyltransferase involved in cell wall biosynthesis